MDKDSCLSACGAGGGGGSGALVFLDSDEATIDKSDLEVTGLTKYDNYVVLIDSKNASGTNTPHLRFNGLSTSVYAWTYINVITQTSGTSDDEIDLTAISSADSFYSVQVYVQNDLATSKSMTWLSGQGTSGTAAAAARYGSGTVDVGDIDQITFYYDVGNVRAGSRMKVYGVVNA